MIVAIDTETTGTDFHHGCGAFMVTACTGEKNYFWIGHVNPKDRSKIKWKSRDIDEIQELVDSTTTLLFHNAKFDVRALELIGVSISPYWDKIEDTLIASHVICSGEPHGLKYLAYKYLDYYNEGERELEASVKHARLLHQKDYDIAKRGHKCFPGLSGPNVKWFKMDYWLCLKECLKYGMADVEMTWLLWKLFSEVIEYEGLEEQYTTRKELLHITYDMESIGMYCNTDNVHQTIKRLEALKEVLRKHIQEEIQLAHHLDLTNESHIRFLLFDLLQLPVVSKTEKTGRPSVNKESIQYYINQYPDNIVLSHFAEFRQCTTKIGYLKSYLKWVNNDSRIRSSFLITGTRETRQASTSPNTQNIDKSLKSIIFEPPPGFVWLDYDLVNIELRIWGYSVNNKEMVEIFDNNQSFHMVIAEMLYPDLVANGEFKKEFPLLYQYIKNGNFSIIYGAGKNKADRTYQLEGAYDKVIKRFPEVPTFTEKVINEVINNQIKYGIPYLTCLGGYRLEVDPNELHTKACNYYSQGSAGYIINLSMIEVNRNPLYRKCQCRMINQVHDSLRIQVPKNTYSPELALSLQKSIEAGGEKLLPTCEAELEATIYSSKDL